MYTLKASSKYIQAEQSEPVKKEKCTDAPNKAGSRVDRENGNIIRDLMEALVRNLYFPFAIQSNQ